MLAALIQCLPGSMAEVLTPWELANTPDESFSFTKELSIGHLLENEAVPLQRAEVERAPGAFLP